MQVLAIGFEKVILFLDSIRFSVLRYIMKKNVLSSIYSHRPLRLGFRFGSLTLLTLPLSVFCPGLLLVTGPIIFGYFHLISSAQHIQTEEMQRMKFFEHIKPGQLVLISYLLSFVLKYSLEKIDFWIVNDLPLGIWEAGFACILFLVLVNRDSLKAIQSVSALLLLFIFSKLSYWDPLLFVGLVLILHNWAAVIFWLLKIRDHQTFKVAIACFFIFLFIHIVVLVGYFDDLILMKYFSFWKLPWDHLSLESVGTVFLNEQNLLTRIFSFWSTDPIYWNRFLVIYSYGLSIHYFAWLSAIPESQSIKEFPLSFRMTIHNLKRQFGSRFLQGVFLLIAAAILLWLFSYPLGRQVYFSVALLHGWLEFFFALGLVQMTSSHRHSFY